MPYCQLEFELEELHRIFGWFVVVKGEGLTGEKDYVLAEKIGAQMGKPFERSVRKYIP